MQQSGTACRISFEYHPDVHSFEVVGRLLKKRFKLQDAVGKLKVKIQNEYEALKKGEDRSSFVEEEIAIMDDASFLINRDMRQEILYKQIQRLKNQIRENEALTLDQWKAIDVEHKRHERELSRIEKARQEATERRRKRLLENQEKEKEAVAAETKAESSLASLTEAAMGATADSTPVARSEALTLDVGDSREDVKESATEQRAPQAAQIMSEKPDSENL
jgi:hypothetical protein